jgi:glycosyltransferase involved in cell wall biosynthesis
MRLLYITNQICGSGGLERVLSIKASYLADKLGYEVHIITLNQSNVPLFYSFSKELIYHDISLQGNFINYSYRYAKYLNELVQSIKPDVISVCDDGLKGLLSPFILDKKTPKIYERHVSKNIEIKTDKPSIIQRIKTKTTFAFMQIGAKRFDKFILLTKGNAKEWELPNIQIISNPLSFFPESPATLDTQKVLAVGRHAYQKGYDRLLESWQLIKNEFQGWQIDIFGKIDSAENYVKLARQMDVSDSVFFHEPVKNIQDKYREASVYVMPSRYEGFGMVLIEAMAYGIPCISYDCPYGPGDIITDGVDGFLVKNGDIEAFSLKMSTLMGDVSLRKEMGLNARKKAQTYSVEAVMPIWDRLFKKLVYGS